MEFGRPPRPEKPTAKGRLQTSGIKRVVLRNRGGEAVESKMKTLTTKLKKNPYHNHDNSKPQEVGEEIAYDAELEALEVEDLEVEDLGVGGDNGGKSAIKANDTKAESRSSTADTGGTLDYSLGDEGLDESYSDDFERDGPVGFVAEERMVVNVPVLTPEPAPEPEPAPTSNVVAEDIGGGVQPEPTVPKAPPAKVAAKKADKKDSPRAPESARRGGLKLPGNDRAARMWESDFGRRQREEKEARERRAKFKNYDSATRGLVSALAAPVAGEVNKKGGGSK